MKKIYTILLLCFFSFFLNAQYTWVNKQEPNAVKRGMPASFEIYGKGYIVGGKISNSPVTYAKDTWEYDASLDTWTAKAAFPYNFAWPGYFAIEGVGYVVGGQDDSHVTYVNTMYGFDPLLNTWTQKASFPEAGVGETFQFVLNEIGYVGAGTRNAAQPSATMYAYNPANNTWTQKANYPGALSIDAVGFAIDSFGYAGLGGDGNSAVYKQFYKYNPYTNTWSQIANFPGKARLGAMAFVINGRAYVGGGICLIGSSLYCVSDFYEYDPQANTWTPVPGLPGAPRGVTGMFTIGNSGYFTGGYDWDNSTYYSYVSQFTDCGNVISHLTYTPGDTQEMKLYPNPTTEELNVAIDGTVTSKLEYEIYAIDGKLVRSGNTTQNSFRISIKEMADGVYLFNMKDGNTNYTVKRFEVMH